MSKSLILFIQVPNGSRAVDGGGNLIHGVLNAHRATPDLGIVEEEELIVRQIGSG